MNVDDKREFMFTKVAKETVLNTEEDNREINFEDLYTLAPSNNFIIIKFFNRLG